MTNDPSNPSELRQYIDLLGTQFLAESVVIDPALILQCCKNIAATIHDESKPLPPDVFAAGINDKLARLTLSSMCAAIVEIVQQISQKALEQQQAENAKTPPPPHNS